MAAVTQHGNCRRFALSLKCHRERVPDGRRVAEAEPLSLLARHTRRDHDAVSATNDLPHTREAGCPPSALTLTRLDHPHDLGVRAITDLKHVRVITGYTFRVWR